MKIIITKQQLETALRLIKSGFDDVYDKVETVESDSISPSDLPQYLMDSINGLESNPGDDKLSLDLSEADNSNSEFITISDVNDAIDEKMGSISGTIPEFVDAEISEAIAGLQTIRMEIVDTLPSPQDADENVLYLKYNDNTEHYDIYAKIGNELVWIDDTNASIEGYVSSISTDITSGQVNPDSNGNIYLELSDGVESLIADKLGTNISTTVEDWVSGNFVQKESGKSLVSDSEIQKLQNIESNAEENVIESIQKNGTTLPVSNKVVNIEVPTSSDIQDMIEDTEISVEQIDGTLPVSKGGTGSSSFNDGVLVVDSGEIKSENVGTFISDFDLQKQSFISEFDINVNDWEYQNSVYKATIEVQGCTSHDFPIVSFNQNDIESFGISSRCESILNGIVVTSQIQPNIQITGTYAVICGNVSV